MATVTDKKKLGYTLADRCKAEEEKLRNELAKQLREDMKRLYTDSILTDLVIKAGRKEFLVHKIIFQDVGGNLYSEMMSLPGSSEETGIIVLPMDKDPEKLKDILSTFYTKDDISSSVRELRKYFKASSNEEVDSSSLKCATDPIKANDSGPRDVNKNEDRKLLKDIFTKEDGTETADTLENGFVHMGDGTYTSNTLENDLGGSGFMETQLDIDNKNCIAAKLVAGLANPVDTKAGSVENLENCDEKQDCLGAVKLESNVSRIPVSEMSTGELVKRELGIGIVPEACSVLGEDLLRKLVGGVACDCVVSVGDWDFPAHRCMLAARSSYFAMMLNGSWMESDSEKIILEGVDASVVKQMLLYIYGGVLDLDPGCSIGGLVMIADMYDVIGMKSIVSLILNKDYCHFFHKPCPGCIAGVPETLPLTMMYNMPDMCEKCVRWINKHKEKVWVTKSFALLPHECLEHCTQAAIKDLNLPNIIESLLEFQRLNLKVPRLKWTTTVLYCVATLLDSALEYASQNFLNIVSGREFKQLDGKSLGFNMSSLEEIFSLIITSLTPGVACESYLTLHTLMSQIQAYFKLMEEKGKFKYDRFSEEYAEFVGKLCKKCKEQLCLYIHQAVNTQEWFLLSTELQKEIMNEASYVCLDSPGRGRMAAKPKLTSMKKKPLGSEFRVSMKEYFDNHFGPKETFPNDAIPKNRSRLPQKLHGTPEKHSKLPTKGGLRKATDKPVNQKTGQRDQVTKSVGGKIKCAREKSENLSDDNLKSNKKIVKKSTSKAESKIVSKSKNAGTKLSRDSDRELASVSKLAISGSKLGKSNSKGHDPSRMGTNSSDLVNCKHETVTNDSEHFEEEIDSDSANQGEESAVGRTFPYMESVARKRSNSASSSSFKPHFGMAPAIQTSHSDDSFFGSERQGQQNVVKMVPTMDVKFVVPLEFYEQF